jgi:hypothetical protein
MCWQFFHEMYGKIKIATLNQRNNPQRAKMAYLRKSYWIQSRRKDFRCEENVLDKKKTRF